MLKGYFSKSFTNSFLTIYIPLFAIASLILFISMASITSYIEVNLAEMLLIFSYSLPEILFYTLPVAFVIASAVTLNRLSHDYELIVLFSAGISPFFVIRRLLFIAVAMTLLLLAVSLLLIPQTKQMYSAFKNHKVANAKLNIKPSELGQKFGNFFVYVASEDKNGIFEDVVVFKKDKTQEQIFLADNGVVNDRGEDMSFRLINGEGYTYDEQSIQKIVYRDMVLHQASIAEDFEFQNISEYWLEGLSNRDKKEDFKRYIFISLMPLATLLLVSAFSIIHPRYQKSRLFLTSLLTIVGYLVLFDAVAKQGGIAAAAVAFIAVIALGLYFFKRNVLRHY